MAEHPAFGKELRSSILLSLKNLPAMPRVMQKAMEILHDPDCSFKELGETIELDQSLTMKILKMSNSAYFRRSRKVTNVKDAAIVLGTNNLAEIVTLAASRDLLGKALDGYGYSTGTLWEHSMAVAFGAKKISDLKGFDIAGEAFTAGLIHDVGKIILDPYIKERKDAFLDSIEATNERVTMAEKATLGFDHTEIAGTVCKKWNIPESISTAIRLHHKPSKIQGNILAGLVYMANQMAIWNGLDTAEGVILDIEGDSMDLLGLQPDEVDSIMDEISTTIGYIVKEI